MEDGFLSLISLRAVLDGMLGLRRSLLQYRAFALRQPPEDLRPYLIDREWRQHKNAGPHLEQWESPSGRLLLLPTEQHYGDFTVLFGEAIDTVLMDEQERLNKVAGSFDAD